MDASRIRFSRQILYIPVTSFAGWVLKEGTPNLLWRVYGLAEANATQQAEISTTGVVGAKYWTNSFVQHLMAIPSDWSRRHPVYARAIWTAAVEGGDPRYRLAGGWGGPGTVLGQIGANLTVAYSGSPILAVAHPSTPAWTVNRSTPIIWDVPPPEGSTWLKIWIELSGTGTPGDQNDYFLGLELEYTPRLGVTRTREGREWRASNG